MEGGAEIPQYSCSKGYSEFNGPEVVERKGRSRRQASSFLHSLALWLSAAASQQACLRGFPTTMGKNVRSAVALRGGTLNGSGSE